MSDENQPSINELIYKKKKIPLIIFPLPKFVGQYYLLESFTGGLKIHDILQTDALLFQNNDNHVVGQMRYRSHIKKKKF